GDGLRPRRVGSARPQLVSRARAGGRAGRRARVTRVLAALHRDIVACTRCARLRAHCADVAAVKRAAYRDESYWGRPLPGFGDPEARLLVVGLGPGAHGA